MVNKIHWFSGMQIEPQQFQQSDLAKEKNLSSLMQYVNPHFFGVVEFEYEIAQNEGELKVTKLIAILAGQVINIEETLVLKLDKIIENKHLVFFVVPTTEITYNSSVLPQNYCSVEEKTKDLNNENFVTKICYLKPMYSLVIDHIPLHHIGFQICILSHTAQGIIAEEYDAPGIYIKSMKYSYKKCLEIVTEIKQKINDMRYGDAILQTTNNIYYKLIKVLFGYEYALKNNLHPFNICWQLLFIWGELSDVPLSLDDIHEYDQSNAFTCIDQLINCVKEVLQNIKQRYNIIQFSKNKSVFYLANPSFKTRSKITVLMNFSVLTSEKDILNWISTCIITSLNQVKSIVDRRAYGCLRKVTETYLKNNNCIFVVEIDIDNAINLEYDFVILHQTNLQPLSISLLNTSDL